jgi:hypothetical protein
MNITEEALFAHELLSQFVKREPNNRLAIEVGAWDGIHKSNIMYLVRELGYKGVFIEGSEKRFSSLKKNYSDLDRVVTINAFVEKDGAHSFDRLLSNVEVEGEVDFLSVDIDGNDYYIFKYIEKYLPNIICIEFNPTIPNDVEYIQKYDPDTGQGTSLLSLCHLAESKGYDLVKVTRINAIFMRSDIESITPRYSNKDLNSLRDDSKAKVYLFSGFDGSIFSNVEYLNLSWHRMRLFPDRISPVPWFMRGLPVTYNPVKRILYLILLFFNRPDLRRWERIRKYLTIGK